MRQRDGHETACVCSEDESEAHGRRACSTAHVPARSRVHFMPISSRRQWPPENTTGRSSRSQANRIRDHLVMATTSTSASADRPSPAARKRVCISRGQAPMNAQKQIPVGFWFWFQVFQHSPSIPPTSHAVNAVRIRCRRECQAGKPPQSALRMLPDPRCRGASRGSAHGPAKLEGACGPARRIGACGDAAKPGHASTGLHFHWLAARHLGIVCV